MIGFHIQYDLLMTVLRTSKGHLPCPISVTVDEHQPEEQGKKDKNRKKHFLLHHKWLEVTHNLFQG